MILGCIFFFCLTLVWWKSNCTKARTPALASQRILEQLWNTNIQFWDPTHLCKLGLRTSYCCFKALFLQSKELIIQLSVWIYNEVRYFCCKHLCLVKKLLYLKICEPSKWLVCPVRTIYFYSTSQATFVICQVQWTNRNSISLYDTWRQPRDFPYYYEQKFPLPTFP